MGYGSLLVGCMGYCSIGVLYGVYLYWRAVLVGCMGVLLYWWVVWGIALLVGCMGYSSLGGLYGYSFIGVIYGV